MAEVLRTRTRPASLWIGGELSALEHLCLKSLVLCGMQPVLFSYGSVTNVPKGVTQKDAGEIVPEDRIWRNKDRNSLAPFSDYFRYRLLAKTSYYWVDCDVLALRGFDFTTDYFLAWSPPVVSNSVLSLPQSSPTLAALIESCEAPNIDMPWLKRDRERLLPLAGRDGALRPEDLPYKALGPRALTWLMRHHDEIGHVLGHETHNVLKPRHVLKSYRRLSRSIKLDSAYSLHLYGSVQHEWFREQGVNRPPEGSFLAELFKKYEVTPFMYAIKD